MLRLCNIDAQPSFENATCHHATQESYPVLRRCVRLRIVVDLFGVGGNQSELPMKLVVLDGQTLNPGDNPWTPVESIDSVDEVVVYGATEASQVVERAVDADILLTNKVVLDRETIDRLPNLKFIAVTATGFNVVDLKAARERRIPVSNVPVYGTDSVAQHVFAMLLAFIHAPERHDQAVRDGQWQASQQFCFTLKPLTELNGKTFGVVGWGRIGRATATLARAFGMRVVSCSRRQADAPDWPGFAWVDVAGLCEQCDVISLHCPLTEESEQMIDAAFLAQMKKSAVLINTARGGLVNESDLAAALQEGQIAGALLDVVSVEPMPNDHPLRSLDNCLVTPHIAWTAIEARQRLMQTTADNVQAFIDGWPINVVNA